MKELTAAEINGLSMLTEGTVMRNLQQNTDFKETVRRSGQVRDKSLEGCSSTVEEECDDDDDDDMIYDDDDRDDSVVVTVWCGCETFYR
jgi:hypothetical protein